MNVVTLLYDGFNQNRKSQFAGITCGDASGFCLSCSLLFLSKVRMFIFEDYPCDPYYVLKQHVQIRRVVFRPRLSRNLRVSSLETDYTLMVLRHYVELSFIRNAVVSGGS